MISRPFIASSIHSIYFSPFLRTSLHSRGIHKSGILIGRIINSGRNVFWNPNSSMSPHIIVVGPTGSGKTETLISIATKMHSLLSTTILAIDVKGDIEARLLKRGYLFRSIDVPRTPLGSLYPFYIDPSARAGQVFEAIVSSFDVNDIKMQAAIYKAIKRAYEKTPTPTWQNILSELSQEDEHVRIMISRIIDEISYLDGGKQQIGHYEIVEGEINIISLSKISKEKEETLSYAMNIVFQDMLNYMSSRHVDPRYVGGAIVIDEAWILTRKGRSSTRLLNLVKLSRGYGLSVLLATQSFRDFGDDWDRILENSGLLIALSNPSKRFWSDASKFLKIDRETIEELMVVMGRGDALIRILPDPRPLPVSLETETVEDLAIVR
ncbi:MAG: ATP-binding protein [Desulfurococcales archaeon]|jgi:DNA helicase HerA-like ATPase|nr:ATP-binding protein [Desulfurococcales archaeon]